MLSFKIDKNVEEKLQFSFAVWVNSNCDVINLPYRYQILYRTVYHVVMFYYIFSAIIYLAEMVKT